LGHFNRGVWATRVYGFQQPTFSAGELGSKGVGGTIREKGGFYKHRCVPKKEKIFWRREKDPL